MAILSCVILFFSVASFAVTDCSAYLSDFAKEFRFIRVNNETNEFKFSSLESDNDEPYSGTALKINYHYFIRDKDDTLYWTDFEWTELEQSNEFIKSVRIVELVDDELHFDSYFSRFKLNLTEGLLYSFLYDTEWNLQNICFTKANAESNTFQFTILSDNNSREYNGTTVIENEETPFVQRIDLFDGSRIEVYEVEFTKDELHSNETFCRGISKIISQMKAPAGYVPNQSIDPNALKSLIG